MASATTFPFDPSGTSAANRIKNEQHVITSQNFRDYHYVVPKFAPFFEKDFSIRLQFPNGSVRNLILGVDYYFSNQFLDASRACSSPIYGSISFLDTDTAGILSISYNTVGGIWNLTADEITRILAEEMRNPRITTWEQVTYLPERFPVVDHEWDLVDMVGASKVVDELENIRATILAANGGGLTDHINNYSNPHNVTKDQVGLANVQDYPVATTLQAQDGISNGFYMTPLRTRDAISAIGGAMVTAHTNRTDNPHSTTKTHVGLGSVQNYAVATQPEAEAGALDTAYMTPLKTAKAIAFQVGTAFTTHVNNKLNPHNVTKEQVGLFNVQNYAVATQQEAYDGVANDKYMTPLRTSQLVTQYVATELDGHSTRTDNPHMTTKAQVGLSNVDNFPLATQAEAQAGISNTAFMSPGRVRDAINALSTPATHMTNLNNPHQVTKAQVGLSNVADYPVATQAEAQAATANDRYMTPLRTKELVTNFVTTQLDGHATRVDNPHATTAAQVGLGDVQNFPVATLEQAQAGAINSAYMTPQRTAEAISALTVPRTHMSDYNNPHQTTAAQVGAYSKTQTDTLVGNYVRLTDLWVAGMTKAAFVAEVLTGKAADADKVYGLNFDDLANTLINEVLDDHYATTAAMAVLAQRVTDLETIINSITVV